jgi:ComF family protein
MPNLDSALKLIAPHLCLGCRQEGTICCQFCLNKLKISDLRQVCYFCNKSLQTQKEAAAGGICSSCKPQQSLDSISYFAGYKDELASSLIKALKFNQVYAAKSPLALALANLSLSLNPQSNSRIIVTAVPTANKRVRARGWDQAKLIAKQYAKLKSLPYKSLLLRSSSFDQIGASKSQRQEASKKFFKPIRLSLIQNSTIILIDDVVTTGSTLNAAAASLKKAGAKEVYALTFARQPLHKTKK